MLEDKINELILENDKILEENKQLRDKCDEVEHSYRSQIQKERAINQQHKNHDEDFDEMKERVNSLHDENHSLKMKVQEMQTLLNQKSVVEIATNNGGKDGGNSVIIVRNNGAGNSPQVRTSTDHRSF